MPPPSPPEPAEPVLEFVPPDEADPRYRAERALRHAVLRAPLGRPPGSEYFPFEPEALHLVARVGDAVIGCVLFHPDGRGGGRALQMAVDPAWQRRGIGRRLLLALADRLRADGLTRMTGHARLSALDLYLRLGARVIGEPYEEVGIPHVDVELAL